MDIDSNTVEDENLMMYHQTRRKDPDATQSYTINWDGIIAYTDSITTATSTPYLDGATTTALTVDSTTNTDLTTTTTLSGGVDDSDYTVIVTITTTAGVTDQRTLLIKCRQR